MGLCTINNITKGSWGILEPYKNEVINGEPGALKRAYEYAIANDFMCIPELSIAFGLSQYRVRKLLNANDMKYIISGSKKRYYLPGLDLILKENL